MANAAAPTGAGGGFSTGPGEVGDVAVMELTVIRLSGQETLLTVPQDCQLESFKAMLAEKGIIDQRLAIEFLVEGRALEQKPEAKLVDLGVDGSAPVTVVVKRYHDYSRITQLECVVKSEAWPQGVLMTQEGVLYVCHFQGELLKFSPQLERISSQMLPRTVTNPSQMRIAPDGNLVFACTRSASAAAAVVDPKTLEVKRFLSGRGGRGLGLALAGGVVYISHAASPFRKVRDACVVAVDYETGETVRTITGFERASGLCVANEQLLVADRGANEVRVLTLDGEDVCTIGQGELKFPNDVAVDCSGNILVMDTGNERVAVFSPEGHLIASVLPKTFTDHGNTHSYISVNPLTGAICVSMDDIHKVAILCPPISKG